MQEWLKLLDSKLDKLDSRLDDQGKTLAVNTTLLDQHIQRTNLLEAKVDDIEEHVTFVKKLGKLIPWLIGIAGSIGGLISYFS